MTRPALLFYCQHSVGMGHLMRSLALLRALTTRFDVTLVSGGALPPFAETHGARVVALPPVGLDEHGALVSRDHRRRLDRALDIRRRMLLDAYRASRPRAVIVELFPFGRRKFAAELEPMLQAARAGAHAARPVVCCSLRDILVSRDKQAKHDDKSMQLLHAYFDAVLVHSDPAFATLEESLAPGVRVPVPVHHTGFVHGSGAARPARRRTPRSSIVVSAGGGLVGEPLLSASIEAQALIPARLRRPLALVAGPFLPEDGWRRLRRLAASAPDVTMRHAVPDLAHELRHAAASVSQCGYNTAMDLLESRVPALVVPYGEANEDEQLKRARRLEALGALRVLPVAEMTPPRLAVEITSLAAFTPTVSRLNLHGADRTADLLEAMLDHDAPAVTAAMPLERIA